MVKRYELELHDPEAGCSFTKAEDGDLCVYADVKKLEDIIKSADSLLEEIFESLPESFMTRYEWDLQWNEITKEAI